MNKLLFRSPFGFGQAPAIQPVGNWSHPEGGLMWALRPNCGLFITIANECRNAALVIDISPAPFKSPHKSRRMEVILEGISILEVHIETRGFFFVPIGKVEASSTIRLDFWFDEAELDVPNESRPLSVSFHNIFVISQPHPPRANIENIGARIASSTDYAIRSEVDTIIGKSLEELLTTFESLGHSCDFGLFQRKCGAEPLGLLRFSGITTRSLIEGLLNRFSGLGQYDTIEARRWPEDGNEYMMIESLYGISTHTFISCDDAAPEQLIARESVRLPFLQRLFLETWDLGEKIYVLRRPGAMQSSEAEAVAAILRLRSDSKLLWAVQDGLGDPGSVDVLSPHMVIGYLDTTQGLGSASFRSWINICLNAHLIFRCSSYRT